MNEITIKNWNLLENPKNLKGYWMTGEEIGKHLGYKNPRVSINNLFNKNSEVFINKIDSCVITSVTEAGSRNITIFSERGSLKLVRYSRTKKSNLIMDEVFDVYLEAKKESGALIKQDKEIIAKQIDLENRKLKLEEKKNNAQELGVYADFLERLNLQSSALAVCAHRAELAGFKDAKKLLPPLDTQYFTPTEISEERKKLTPQMAGKILKSLKLHGKDDRKQSYSQPFKSVIPGKRIDIICYRYKLWIKEKVLECYDKTISQEKYEQLEMWRRK